VSHSDDDISLRQALADYVWHVMPYHEPGFADKAEAAYDRLAAHVERAERIEAAARNVCRPVWGIHHQGVDHMLVRKTDINALRLAIDAKPEEPP
jgi:hypothetical protein